ncbi:helix-turn-helix domain-containing protein [Micromonospora parva]|uniref:Helix-turn-helix domain-containing protein n=1 Tax=Micromonospora parva TaxID=1464048 RepID=A0ABW6VWM8_9ACTN
MERNTALRDFLRSRRAQVSPAQAGLIDGSGRRVPGLRREEVAALAGVSVDYYMRLEQGRNVSPSDSVLDSLATALRLSPAQRAQLYLLVRGRSKHEADSVPGNHPNITGLLRAVAVPAIVVGRGSEVIGANALHRELTTDFDTFPLERRYYAYWLFADAGAREVMVTWEHSARETVGVLRAAVTRFPEDRRLHRLVENLNAGSPEFRELWDEHDVATPAPGVKVYRHPLIGLLALRQVAAQLADDVWLYLYWADPGTDAEATLQRLRDVVADALSRPSAPHR